MRFPYLVFLVFIGCTRKGTPAFDASIYDRMVFINDTCRFIKANTKDTILCTNIKDLRFGKLKSLQKNIDIFSQNSAPSFVITGSAGMNSN